MGITNGEDLNDSKFFNVGKYHCHLNVIAESLKNAPLTTAFTMEVFLSAGSDIYVAQRATEFSSGHCYWRMKDVYAGKIITDWTKLY